MKTKLVISLLIIAIIAISQLIKPEKNISRTNDNGSLNTTTDTLPFFVGAYCDSKETNKSILVDTLSFNFWHTFLGNRAIQDPHNPSKFYYTPVGWNEHDSLYISNTVTNDYVINVLQSNGAELRALMSRPKIEWLFFAQRSDYQCEDTSSLANKTYNWFYTYKEHQRGGDTIDNSPYGQGARVRYCGLGMSRDSGYVVKGLIANREQVNTGNPGHGCPYPGYGDGQFSWYVKPRLRIDSSFAANIINNDTKICRIEVVNYEGTVIKYQDIKVINFKELPNSSYRGNYMETFYSQPNAPIDLTIESGWQMNPNDKVWNDDNHNCQADYRVFWYGLCDMWIDYVRVDDDRANRLFKVGGDAEYEAMIQREVTDAQNKTSPLMFYIDEFEFNHIPAITFVMNKLQQYAGTQSPPFVLATNNSYDDFYIRHLPSGITLGLEHFKRYCLDSCKVSYYGNTATYCFVKPKFPGTGYQTNLPNTLPDVTNQYVYANVVSPDIYENWLQGYLVNSDTIYRDFIPDCIDLQTLTKMKPEMNSFLSVQTHAHNFEDFLREPTNEEIRMMVNTAVSYGIKGIIYYSYDAFGQDTNGIVNRDTFDVGLTNKLGNNANNTPRYINFYGQRKWESIANTNRTLKQWSPYLKSFKNSEIKSFVYNIDTGRISMRNSTYISELLSFQPDNSLSQDPSYNYDDSNHTYSQVSVFNNGGTANNFTNYFMIVNRRCSPHIQLDLIPGGFRYMKIKFQNNNNAFDKFNNWEIKDIRNDSVIKVFNKNSLNFIDLGWYEPGEGRIYKIAPVMVEGGIFVCNEYVSTSAGSIECKGNITNNGYELEIEKGVTINFKDNVGINFSHSRFKCGMSGGNSNSVTILKGKGSEQWNGINLSACELVDIEKTTFQDIKFSDQLNLQNTAICLNNCENIYIANSTFLLTTPSSGIYAQYSEESEEICNIIAYNTFDVNCSYAPTPINIIATSSSEIPIVLQSNVINNIQRTGGVGISISNVTGGAIKNCVINYFSSGINTLSSSLDLSENTISGDINEASGINELSVSDLNLGMINNLYTGGKNTISSEGKMVNNIYTDHSYFNINEGYYTFNIAESEGNCHLKGSFCGSGENQNIIDAIDNCFQINTTNTNQIDSVFWTQSSTQVEFTFKPYSCELQNMENFIVLQTSDEFNYRDTIYKKSTGGSGGNSNPEELQTSNYKTLKDSINLNLRTRNYSILEDQCRRMLLNYPDSSASIGTVAKLYLSSLTLDTLGDKIGPLKTFLETLILNNQGKTALINRAFYFIQKCKVSLKQYTSALQGFELIITQNPYTYEGLIASWDYASTQLLDSLNGGSGGINSKDINENETELIKQITEYYENDLFKDTIKFTKSDRKIIIQNTERAFDDTKTNGTKKYDDVKKRSERGDEKARVEYQKMKTLNETNKIKQPRTTIELNSIIQKDFQKVFVKTEKPKKQENTIPTKYELYQNYPNPFNPTTKIAFDLPKDAKVKLIIYDILGREIKTIVNNEFKPAGKYINEFNGSQFASGVYFARLLVNQGKDFIAVKKLVLIK